MKRWKGGWLGALAALSMLPAHAQSVIEARLAGQLFQLELAIKPDIRRHGLMERDALASNTGMLFDFPEGTRPAIWMRNMLIPLDLLFVDEDARVAHIFSEVPPCSAPPCAIYRADEPLRFVIEVPAGTAAELDLKPGDQLDLGGHQLSPPPPF